MIGSIATGAVTTPGIHRGATVPAIAIRAIRPASLPATAARASPSSVPRSHAGILPAVAARLRAGALLAVVPEYFGTYSFPGCYGRDFYRPWYDRGYGRYKDRDHRGEFKGRLDSSKLSHDFHVGKVPSPAVPKGNSGIGQMGKMASRSGGMSRGSHGGRKLNHAKAQSQPALSCGTGPALFLDGIGLSRFHGAAPSSKGPAALNTMAPVGSTRVGPACTNARYCHA